MLIIVSTFVKRKRKTNRIGYSGRNLWAELNVPSKKVYNVEKITGLSKQKECLASKIRIHEKLRGNSRNDVRNNVSYLLLRRYVRSLELLIL